MQQGRVQTPEFKNNLALKPAARPVDTFEAPAQVPQDNNTARLVDALSAFSNTIGQLAPTLGQAEAAAKNKKDDAALAERQNFFMKASPEEQRRYIVEKHGLDRDEVKQAAAIGKMDGARYAEMVQGELQTHMQTEFDWNSGDPEDYARRFLQDKLQEIGRTDEPTFVSAYSQAGQSFIQNVSAMRIKRQADQMDVKVKGAASDYFRLTVDDSVKAGDDPQVTAKKLLMAASDAGKRGTLLLEDGDVDKYQLDELERRIDSNPQVVIAAIQQGRTGGGGNRPSYIDDPATRDRAILLDRKAGIALQLQRNRQERDTLIAANTHAIESGNGFLGLRDLVQFNPHSGEETVYSVESQKDEAVRNWIKQDDATAKRLGETPPQTILRRAQQFAIAGLQDPDLKAATDSIAQAGSPEVLLQPEAKEKLVQRLELINTVTKTNKNLSASYLKGQDKEFVDGFFAAREALGRDDTAALSFAYAVTNPSPQARSRVFAARHDITNAVKALRDSKWFSLNNPSMENSGMVEDHLWDLSEKYAAAGLSGQDAVAAAKSAIEKSAIHYNGTLIDVGSINTRAEMPSDFKGAVEAQVAAFLEDSKGKAYDASQVTIYQTGDKDGRFYLVDKDTMSPVTDDNGAMHFFTLSNLRAWDNANRQMLDKANASYNAFNQSVNAKGLFQALDKDGSTVWINTDREIWHHTAEEGQTPNWKKTGKRYSRTTAISPSGLPVFKRPERMNQKLKAASTWYQRVVVGAKITASAVADKYADEMQNDASYSDIAKETGTRIAKPVKAATDATIGSAGRSAAEMINGAQDFISVGKKAEEAINERNRGR